MLTADRKLRPCPFCDDPMQDRGGTLQHINQGEGAKRCPISVYAWPIEDADRWNTRAPQTTERQVKVKPLDWSQSPPSAYDHEPFVYWATGVGGYYRAEPDGMLWMARDAFVWEKHANQKAAKAAAQADYERRILSALEPADTGTIQALAEKAGDETLRALMDVINERYRQISVEGWTPEHDDKHRNGEMLFAAACYVIQATAADAKKNPEAYADDAPVRIWPRNWSKEWWKPTNPRRDLIKAAALILAEIERLDRAEKGGDA